jgi:hypothetical protein
MWMSRFLAVLLCAYSLAHANEIYRWVDENGRTHFGDSVPEKYKKSATRVAARQLEPTDAQRRQAAQRAALERARARPAQEENARAPSRTMPPQQSAGAGQSGNANALDCETAHRRYRESIDCFARYMTQSGAPRAEAFDHCKVILDPSPRCGPPKPESSERTYLDPRSSERTYGEPAPSLRR